MQITYKAPLQGFLLCINKRGRLRLENNYNSNRIYSLRKDDCKNENYRSKKLKQKIQN